MLLMQFFMVIFYVMGMLFASSFMERMKTKTGRIAFLITPASAFEKYLSRWLLVTVVFYRCICNSVRACRPDESVGLQDVVQQCGRADNLCSLE